jgi:hypothetical protein|tara:strand:+ start:414 stop:761 length:348 start_codon:yes stop_codon:yes gene_type:complete
MPRINKIQNDATITGDDKLLGSDVSGATRNFKLSDVADFCNTGGSYKHHQNNAATTWTITHNLNLEDYLPHVNIKVSGGGTYNNVQAMGIVTYVNKNELTINLVDPASGYAYIKK